ncbi:MAG TPA: PCMD domain-containing protein, partial [Chitinophagales bacterium]|nr:PCMD domain-containing protein [Chitinophagales bacterium]
MKRILSIISFISICFFSSYGQTAVPNGSFESWSNIGTSTEEPQYYHSNKDGGGWATYGPQTCYRDTSTLNGGSYCAKIISGSALGNVVNGACTTGRVEAPTTNKSDGYIRSESTNTGYITSFTGRPDSLVFWYRYTSVSSDYPTVEARLHVDSAYAPETSNSHHASTNYNIIARALWQGGASSVSGWTRVSVPFTYVDSRTPQYIFITSTSSGNQTGGSSGSTLWLDEITAIYNPTVATGTVNTGPYYVSAATGASISVPFTLTGTFNGGNVVTAQLSDAGGSFASPVNIGSATTGTSGAITATIPAGTASGAGYRVRVVTSSPALTAANNGSNIQVIQVGNSVTSASTQTIAANTNGTNLSVTETPAAGSREWKYATTTGGPYTSFGTPQTGTTYTPNFANAGSYYVVCVSNYPGSLTTTSNEVRINVVANSIAPTASQSILVGVNGNMLTVTESPTGTAREWKYATTSGGPYSSFGTAQTTTTYTPNFAGTGTYYVVCVSTISSVAVTSNEVLVSVGNATIATGAITGSPYLFSPHAPDASVSVPYTTSGTFNGGNTFTAQLSDAAGSFASPVNIGSVSATSSGNISASIPHITAAGTGYRIRVVSSSPVVLGSDNGADLAVDQFHNSVAPGSTQAIALNTNGTNITVTESQTATHNWEYSTTSGSGYM